MKKILSIIMTIITMTIFAVPTTAASNIKVMLNGEEIKFDVQPQFINNRTMVPLRAIFEALGATVEWDGDSQTVTSTKDDTTISLTINNPTMKVNDSSITLDSPACIVNDRTLVPVRAVSESFKCQVGYDGATTTVSIISDSENYQMLYTPDNRAKAFGKADVSAQTGVGWYTEPVVTMYAVDGRTRITAKSEVEEYKKVGWYTEPVVTMYAADGRTRVTLKSEVEAYKKVGWFTTKPTVDVSKNITQIRDFINKGMYLEAIRECDNLAAYSLSDADKGTIANLKNTAKAKYNEFQAAEKTKKIDAFAAILVDRYRSAMKDPSSFALNSIYAGYNSSLYSSYDFVAVVNISGKNSFGATVRDTTVMLLNTATGQYILDFVDFAENKADDAYGASRIGWLDKVNAGLEMEMYASSRLTKLNPTIITSIID